MQIDWAETVDIASWVFGEGRADLLTEEMLRVAYGDLVLSSEEVVSSPSTALTSLFLARLSSQAAPTATRVIEWGVPA